MPGEISTQMIQWTDEAQTRLRALWLAYYSNTKIADVFRCTTGAVAAQAWKMKLPYRERSDFHKFQPDPKLEIWPPRLEPIPPQPKPAPPPPPRAPKLSPPSGRVLAVKPDKPIPAPKPPKRLKLTEEQKREKARLAAKAWRDAKIQKEGHKKGHKKVTRQPSQILPRGPVKITKDTRVWSDQENQADIEQFIATKGITKCLPPSQIPVSTEPRSWEVRKAEAHRIMSQRNKWIAFRQQTFARRVS